MSAAVARRGALVWGGLAVVLLLALAVSLRVYLATTAPYISDEESTSIPIAQTISFRPGSLHLPIRGENHPALPAYAVKTSSLLFGASPLGYRSLHVVMGLLAVLAVYRVTRLGFGPLAGVVAGALLAFNEYFLTISSRATAAAPYLLFVSLAILAFCTFLARQRPGFLYLAGACTGLAFYCKEHAVLLLPMFLFMLCRPAYRSWLRGPHAYLAVGVFMLVVSPDLVWNLTRGPQMVYIDYGGHAKGTIAQATYGSHLQRIGGLGLSPYPLMFYARDAVMTASRALAGVTLVDNTPEYHAMNSGLGLVVLALVGLATVRATTSDVERFLLVVFWGVFAFYSLIRPGNPPGRLDPVSWVWVEASLIPACVLGGSVVGRAAPRWRVVSVVCIAALLAYSVVQVVR